MTTAKTYAQAELASYLQLFPNDASRLNTFDSQLKEDAADIGHRSNMRGHVTTSAIVVDPAGTKILLIHHKVYDVWLQPGGHYEGDGHFWESARREVTEETGVANLRLHDWCVRHNSPIDIDTHAIAENSKKNEGAHLHHDFMYLFVADDIGELTPQLEEVHGVQWARLEDVAKLPSKRLPRLVARVKDILTGALPE